MRLSAKQWQHIHAFQAGEIERLASDKEFALASSRRPHFTRVGEWLTEGEQNQTVLELGCGPGRYAAMLSSLGYAVTGVDPSSFPAWEMIRRHTSARLMDEVFAEDLPFEDESFDNVACLGALLYFADADKALSEIKRVLRPGGKFYVRTVNRRNLYWSVHRKPIDPASTNHYTEAELAAFLESHGFEVSKTFSYGFYPPYGGSLWWWLSNGTIAIGMQEMLSRLTPKSRRVNVVAYCRQPDESRSDNEDA